MHTSQIANNQIQLFQRYEWHRHLRTIKIIECDAHVLDLR